MMKASKFLSTIVLLAFASLVIANQPAKIERLSASDESSLQRQRNIIERLVNENFGRVDLDGGPTDIYYLQKLFDRGLVEKNDEFDLQAMGVVLGDVMARNLGLKWVKVEDRYGKSRALQFEDSQHLFFPITMISRRVKAQRPVNVQALYDQTQRMVKDLIYDRRYRQPSKYKRSQAISL